VAETTPTRLGAVLLDRLTRCCHMFGVNGERFRFRESVKAGKARKAA